MTRFELKTFENSPLSSVCSVAAGFAGAGDLPRETEMQHTQQTWAQARQSHDHELELSLESLWYQISMYVSITSSSG